MQSETAADQAPRGLKTAGVVALVVAIGAVAAGVLVRSGEEHSAQSWANARSIPTVHLVAVEASAASDGLTLPGTMAAWNAARMYARIGGYVRGWSKDIGAQVQAGTALGVIDTPELDQQIVEGRAALASARANAGLARSTADRWNDLLATASVSKQEADEKNGDLAVKTAAVQGAQANLARLMAMKAYATIRAPFAGIVTGRTAEIGDLVGPSAGTAQQPLFTVADVHRIRLYVNVPQAFSAAMKPGLTATLTAPDFPGRTFSARVTGASGAINPQTGTLQVQLLAENPDTMLKPGGYAQVTFDLAGQPGTVTIPSSTLVFRAAGTQVATIGEDGRVSMKAVTIGRDLGGKVEVVQGLAAGARIVDSPPDSIAQGELVRVGGASRG